VPASIQEDRIRFFQISLKFWLFLPKTLLGLINEVIPGWRGGQTPLRDFGSLAFRRGDR